MATSTWRRAVLKILEVLVLAQPGEPPACFCRKSRWSTWSLLFNELPGLQIPEEIFIIIHGCLLPKPCGAFSAAIVAVAYQDSGWVSFPGTYQNALLLKGRYSPK